MITFTNLWLMLSKVQMSISIIKYSQTLPTQDTDLYYCFIRIFYLHTIHLSEYIKKIFKLLCKSCFIIYTKNLTHSPFFLWHHLQIFPKANLPQWFHLDLSCVLKPQTIVQIYHQSDCQMHCCFLKQRIKTWKYFSLINARTTNETKSGLG